MPGFQHYIHQTRKNCFDVFNLDNGAGIKSVQLNRVFESLRTCSSHPAACVVIYTAKFMAADLNEFRLTGDKLSGTRKYNMC